MGRAFLSDTVLAFMAAEIAPLDTELRRQQYIDRDIPRGDRVQDIDMRYRWDLFWMTGIAKLMPEGTKDAHIDTALRRLVKPLGEPTREGQ